MLLKKKKKKSGGIFQLVSQIHEIKLWKSDEGRREGDSKRDKHSAFTYDMFSVLLQIKVHSKNVLSWDLSMINGITCKWTKNIIWLNQPKSIRLQQGKVNFKDRVEILIDAKISLF